MMSVVKKIYLQGSNSHTKFDVYYCNEQHKYSITHYAISVCPPYVGALRRHSTSCQIFCNAVR